MPKKEPGKKNKNLTTKEINQALLDNFINLQRVLTNVSIKFDDLSSNISKLLQLFEISAQNFVEKAGEIKQPQIDKEFLEKLNSLLDQNKTISKGIMMMEGKIKGRNPYPPQHPSQSPSQSPSQYPSQPIGQEQEFRGMLKSKPLPRY